MSILTDPATPRGRAATLGLVTGTTAGVVGTEALTPATDAKVTAVAGRVYLVILTIAVGASIAGGTDDIIELNLRDGGASAPTTTSTLVTTWRLLMPGTTRVLRQTFAVPLDGLTAGTHRLGVSANRLAGTGTYTIGSATAGLETTFDVWDQGLA